MTEPTAAAAASSTHAEEAPHDEHHVHVYQTSGIAEGNAKVPLWFIAVIVSLFAFFAGYIALHLDAQKSTAHAK